MPRNYDRVRGGQRIRVGDITDLQKDVERLQRGSAGPGMGMIVNAAGVHYTPLSTTPSTNGFFARITSYLQENQTTDPNRYTYSFEQVEKTDAGYGGWSAKSDGLTGTAGDDTAARNFIEDRNVHDAQNSYLLGNGVTTGALVGTFSMRPCPTGNIVYMHKIKLTDGTVEYWFAYENGISGSCPT